MISEVSKSIKATLYERAISPISGMFVIAWLAWNWKLVLVIGFADYGVDKKIFTITNNYTNLNDNIIGPLVSAAILVVVYPVISILPVRLWEWANSYKLKMKHRYSLQVPLSLEQSISLKQEMQMEKQKLNEVMDEYRLKYEQQKAVEAELTQRLAASQNEIQRLQEIVSDQKAVANASDEDQFSAAFSIASRFTEIAERISALKPGDRITFKSLVPQKEWVNVPETQRKLMGKEFKQMVDRGDFVGITALPEKTSANEQLYLKEDY